jgi:hypothetical protein
MADENRIVYEAKLLCYNAFELKNIEIDLNNAIDFCKNHSGTPDMLLCMYFKEILNIDISYDSLKYDNKNVLTNSSFDNNEKTNNLDVLSEIEFDYKKFQEIFPNTDYAWFEERYNKLTVSHNGNSKLEQMMAFK